jgi:alkylated DNA repair protein alkB homolog 6
MNQHQIQGLPQIAYYLPNFISVEEEERILAELQRLPPSKWTTLSHRRLLSLPSTLARQAKDTLLEAPLPKFLDEPILSRFKSLQIFSDSPHQHPNHVLVNEYQPGQGIMPHEDGPAYFPLTATVSLSGHTILEIYKKNDEGEREVQFTWRILQEPRSLLVTAGDMYKDTLHGISEVHVDYAITSKEIINWDLLGDTAKFESGTAERHTRVSLTYRDVLKVAKIGGALKFMNKR